jgi:hypothetical protein
MFSSVGFHSVVTVSVRRFTDAILVPQGAMCRGGGGGRKTKYSVLATVRALGFFLSLPHALIAEFNVSFHKVFSKT